MIKVDLKPPESQLRQFGWIALLGFPLMGIMLTRTITGAWQFDHPLFLTLAGVGVLTFVLAKISPKLILPIYVGLMIIAAPIGLVVSFVVMSIIFYLMITPLGLLFRLFGRDPLHKAPDPKLESYWHVRKEQPAPSSYLKQY